MTINEIIKKIIAVGEGRTPKTIVSFGIEGIKENGERKERAFVGTLNPIIKINSLIDKTAVDIIFSNDFDVELKRLYNVLKDYGDQMNDYILGKTEEVPIFTCILLPEEDEGRIFAAAHNPIMWALTAEDIGKPLSVIRVVFDAEDIGFYSADNIDMNDVKTEIEIEKDKRAFAQYMDEIKREERIKHMDEIEKYRKEQM